MRRKLLRSQIRINRLKELKKKSITHDSAIGIDNMTYSRFKQIEQSILVKIRRKVLDGSYHFKTYKEKLIIKSRNEYPRCISIPTLTDKLCLKALNETLKNYYPEYQRTKLPQEWIKELRKDLAIKRNNIFLKIDIKSFFDTINHKLLLKKLKKRIKDKVTLSLITEAIENPTGFDTHKNCKGLPQGIAISNILSHIYLKDLDEYYDKRDDLIYIRYVDDLLILCSTKTQAQTLKKEIENKLKDEFYLDINEQKGKIGDIYNDKFNFLGYEIGSINSSKNEFKIVMNKKSVLKIEQKIINVLTVFKKERKYTIEKMIFNLNLLITGCLVQNESHSKYKYDRRGWLFYYLQITDITVLYHLDQFIRDKIKNIAKIDNDVRLYGLKKFSKTYFEMKYNLSKSTYIFNINKVDKENKQRILKEFYNKEPDEENIDRIFRYTILNQIKNYEQDIISQIS